MKRYPLFPPVKIGLLLCAAVLLTVCTAGCAKKHDIKRSKVEKQQESATQTAEFAEAFFYACNLPYRKVKISEVQNTPEEYLFYIDRGEVYRTVNDCCVVIVARIDIREPSERVGTNYSGELYRIFEDDGMDLLRYSAAGDYAIMANPGAIPDWEENELITAFMEYAGK